MRMTSKTVPKWGNELAKVHQSNHFLFVKNNQDSIVNGSPNRNLPVCYSDCILIPSNLFFVRTLYFKVYVAIPLTIAS